MPITKASASAVAPAAKGDLVVGSATNDAAVLAVGSANQVLTVDSSTTTGLKWATTATSLTWTGQAISADSINVIAYNGNNLYVGVGNAGTLLTSTDGKTWTSRTSGFGANIIQDVTWDSTNSLWIAVGNNGTITTSSDGTTWTARTSNMSTNSIYKVFASGGTIVAVGDGGGSTNTGGITYSTNGTTWTRKSQTLTVGTSYTSVIYNGTNWVVGADRVTNNYLYASTPSDTWTAGVDVLGDGTIYLYAWDGTRMFYGNSADANIRYTTSTTLASGNALTNFPQGANGSQSTMRRTYYYNGRLYTSNAPYLADFSTSSIVSTNYVTGIGTTTLAPIGISSSAISSQFVGAVGRIIFIRSTFFTSF
jgi:hypothetical protein